MLTLIPVFRIHESSNYLMVDGPLCQLVPLLRRPAVDGEPEFQVLVLGLLHVVHHLVDQLPKELAPDVVVRLHENLTQPRLTDRVVLGIELVETMEGVAVLKARKWM